MRLLQIITYLGQGGAERMVLQLSAAAVEAGDQVAIASTGGPWDDRPAAIGAEFHRVPLMRRSGVVPPGSVMQLRRVLRDFRPDIVHTHSVGVTLAARMAMTGLRRRPALLTTFHGLAPDNYRSAGRLLRLSAPRVIACSSSVARSLGTHGYPPGRLSVIPNGAKLEPAEPAAIERIRAQHRLGTPLVVGVGRLVAQKSWHTLIEAARDMGDADVVIAGPGPLHGELQALANNSRSNVRLLGPVDDVAALLGAATCFVSTSFWEGLPLTLLEALSLGVPAITTAVDGVRDVVTDDAALIVPVGDAAAVRSAIEGLLVDPALAARLSQRGSELAREWSPERMLERYRAAYAEAVRSASG